ncbi:hypothetical protein F6Y03_02305 [Bacillus megaterium]|nr:hypothetical protein [Priestia megaterium]
MNKLEQDNQRLKEVNDQLLKKLDSIHSAMTEIQKEQGKSIWKECSQNNKTASNY